jgi:HEPN domain-containing protein
MGDKQLNEQEWLEYALADLSSAEILLNESVNYHIVVYHAHQAVEKIFKRFLLLKQGSFPFIHELVELLKKISESENNIDLLEDISFLMDLYVNVRYPHNNKITKEEALKSVEIAKKIIGKFK